MTMRKTFYEWKSKMADTYLFWKNWKRSNTNLHQFSYIFRVKESKNLVILMIRGQGRNTRSPEGQYHLITGKFCIKLVRRVHHNRKICFMDTDIWKMLFTFKPWLRFWLLRKIYIFHEFYNTIVLSHLVYDIGISHI